MFNEFNEHDMYSNVRDNLRKRYSASDGWEIYYKCKGEGYELDFLVQRVTEIYERVVVEVKSESVVKQSHIDQINRYSRTLSGNNCFIVSKILVYPSGVDLSHVPDDIEVMTLRSFGY